MKLVRRTIVSALIFSKDSKIFMGHKDPNAGGVYAECWHIPGGGVEEGETKIQALIREVKEETGISILESQVTLIDDQGSAVTTKIDRASGEEYKCQMQFNVYRVDLTENAENVRVSLDDDLVKHVWVEIGELDQYKLTPPSVKLFTKLGYLK